MKKLKTNQGMIWYGMLVSQGMIQYISMLVWYDLLVSLGIVGYDEPVLQDMVWYISMVWYVNMV